MFLSTTTTTSRERSLLANELAWQSCCYNGSVQPLNRLRAALLMFMDVWVENMPIFVVIRPSMPGRQGISHHRQRHISQNNRQNRVVTSTETTILRRRLEAAHSLIRRRLTRIVVSWMRAIMVLERRFYTTADRNDCGRAQQHYQRQEELDSV